MRYDGLVGIGPSRARVYRAVLGFAAAWNLAFGLFAGLFPPAFFRVFGLPAPRYPSIWACLGMVVGAYGLLYAWAARHPERARPVVAVGLLGKILGPAGWVLAVRAGELPARTFPLVALNDLLWWLPFSLLLLEGTRLRERLGSLAPFACAAANALASAAMLLVLRGGSEVIPDPGARVAYIAGHRALWSAGWLAWMAAGATYLGFLAWWGARCPSPRAAAAAFSCAAAGILFDWTAEALFIGWLPDDIAAVQRLGEILSGGIANGLYSLAGAILTAATPSIRGWLRRWAWVVWVAGFALTGSALAGSVPGMVASTAVTMALFCPWVVAAAVRLRRGRLAAAAGPP